MKGPLPAGEVARFRQLHGLHGDPIIGFIGPLGSGKDLDTFLRAVPALLPSFPRLQVLFVGDGPSRENLVRLAYQLGIADRVVIVHSMKDTRVPLAVIQISVEDPALRARIVQAARKRILIVSVNWLGDLLFLTPAIRAIRRAHPNSFIACLAPPRGLELLQGNPHLNEVIPVEETRGPGNLLVWWKRVGRLREGRFDTVFLFHRSFTRALAVRAAGIPERIGHWTWKRGWLLTTAVHPPRPDSVHKIDLFLRIVEAAGIRPDGRQYDAGLLPEDRAAAERIRSELGLKPKDRVVALHAGANWRLKRWPPKNFARAADELVGRYGVKVLFIGGQGDLPLIEGIVGRMKSRPLIAAGRTTFRQMGALLEQSSLLISNDSGPLHMGLAVGVPVVALFGPTDPKLTGPAHGACAVTLFGSIGCPVPCYQLRCPANLCMEQITVEQVLEAAGKFLEGSDP